MRRFHSSFRFNFQTFFLFSFFSFFFLLNSRLNYPLKLEHGVDIPQWVAQVNFKCQKWAKKKLTDPRIIAYTCTFFFFSFFYYFSCAPIIITGNRNFFFVSSYFNLRQRSIFTQFNAWKIQLCVMSKTKRRTASLWMKER